MVELELPGDLAKRSVSVVEQVPNLYERFMADHIPTSHFIGIPHWPTIDK